jgi:hypothetical protein
VSFSREEIRWAKAIVFRLFLTRKAALLAPDW